jgi:hypothetical protein
MHLFHLVHHAYVSTHHYKNKIAIIIKYMAKNWVFQLCHSLGEGNIFARKAWNKVSEQIIDGS